MKRKKLLMDDQTAIAFAIVNFFEIHPEAEDLPWLSKCSTIGHTFDKESNYIVSLCVTLKENLVAGEPYFEVKVNPANGDTEVIFDSPVESIDPRTLEGYE